MPTDPRRRTLFHASAVFLLVAGACAHVQPAPPAQADAVTVGDVAVVLRYDPTDAEVAGQVARALRAAVPVAERWGSLPSPITLTLHPTHDALEEASRQHGHAWLRAWARVDTVDMQSPRTWSRGFATDGQLVQLLAHELTHCAMFAALGGDTPRAREVPAWFREGMATTNAGERFAAPGPQPLEALTASAALYRTDAPLVYATADHAFRFLERRHGRARIRAVLDRVRGGVRFPQAFQDELGESLARFEEAFQEALRPAPSAG